MKDQQELGLPESPPEKAYSFRWTDGGAKAAGFRERSDCTVRALQILSGKPYELVHAVTMAYGRKQRRGFKAFERAFPAMASRLGMTVKEIYWNVTVEKVIRAYPTHRLMIQIRGHVFAVVDGVIHDTWHPSLRCRVRHFWKVAESKEKSDEIKNPPLVLFSSLP